MTRRHKESIVNEIHREARKLGLRVTVGNPDRDGRVCLRAEEHGNHGFVMKKTCKASACREAVKDVGDALRERHNAPTYTQTPRAEQFSSNALFLGQRPRLPAKPSIGNSAPRRHPK